MIEPILTYGKLRLLNVPGGKPVYDEVLVADCYRRHTVPKGSTVIDVGGFYGEFGLWCAVEKGCVLAIYEPSKISWQIAVLNARLNDTPDLQIYVVNKAIGRGDVSRSFCYSPQHPAGSRIGEGNESYLTECTTLASAIPRYAGEKEVLCVKLDCEGAEREIFQDESWIPCVSWLAMEWHNKDGNHYRDILLKHGFRVELSEENPEVVRGTLWATKL
jgi:FkbM family methyltransferase